MSNHPIVSGGAVVHCVVSPDFAPKLIQALRRHYSDHPVLVVVETRTGQRRASVDRRTVVHDVPRDRRRIRNSDGRRIADRRNPVVAVDPVGELPRRIQPHLGRLAFLVVLAPTAEQLEDRDSARLVTRIQAGDVEVFAEIYMRYFDRVYSYLRVMLRDPDEAQDATQQAFTEVLAALPRYERRQQLFAAWLMTVVRNTGINQLRRQSRLEPVDPMEVDRRRDRAEVRTEVDSYDDIRGVLRWISDSDVLLFIERLPLAQRQVLTLKYMAGMSTAEIATVLDRSPETVRMQLSRALAFLRERLTAVGRVPRSTERQRSRVFAPQMRVLRVRRFSLLSNGPSG